MRTPPSIGACLFGDAPRLRQRSRTFHVAPFITYLAFPPTLESVDRCRTVGILESFLLS